MAERIYLGALLDINKNQYLPIMKETYNQINGLDSMPFGLDFFDNDKIIYHTTTDIYIRYANNLEIFKQIISPKKITLATIGNLYSGIFYDKANNKIYCITSNDNTNYFIAEYDLLTNLWKETPITLTGNDKYILKLFVYDNKLVIITIDLAITFSLSNYQKLNSIYIGSIYGYNVTAEFDGNFLYITRLSGDNIALYKYDKTTLTVVGTTLTVFTGNSSSRGRVEYSLLRGNYLYLVGGDNSASYSNKIAKIDIATMSIVVKSATFSNYIFSIGFSENDRMYGAYAGFLYEIDINTLTPKTIGTNGGRYILGYDKTDTLISGLTQLERSYTIQSYKKILE